MIHMETERLIIRDYAKAEKELYFKLKSDERTMYYLQDIKLHSKEEAEREFLEVLRDAASDNRRFYFLHMELKSTGEQVGSIGYTVTDTTPLGKMVHAGYFIYPQYWNQGYMSEAFQRILEFAFEENDVYRLSTGCLAENKASEKVMQKCGLIKEAEHADYEWHDGRMKTRVEYRILKQDRAVYQEKSVIHCITDKKEKEKIAAEVLADLPEWFGLSESTKEYIRESQEMPFWAAEENEKAVGFLALKETSPHTVEIYVMGVMKHFHKGGIGRSLFEAAHSYAKERGYSYMQVKTVQERHYEEYDRTSAFYKGMGFRELEVFPELWDTWNPCQIYVMAL